jgi:hypothetical protein
MAYHRDPFHPRNRWFQRAFGGRDSQGGVLPAHADEPAGIATRYSPVDCAELTALLEAVLREEENALRENGLREADPRGAVTEAIFRSDSLHEAARIHSLGPRTARENELVSLLLRVGRGGGEAVERLEESLPLEVEPPPLRQGDWLEAELSGSVWNDGLPSRGFPSPADLRWARLLREKPTGSSLPRSVLLRLRVGLDGRGDPLPLSLASECLEVKGDEVRVWRFDRAEWLSGREPWRESSEGAKSPASALPAPPAEAFSRPYVRGLDSRQREKQKKLLKDALAPIPGAAGA